MDSALVNKNPIVYAKRERRVRTDQSNTNEFSVKPIDQLEVFDYIRDIKDPEHPEHPELSLEELRVITEESVEVDDGKSYTRVTFRPTLPQCHMPTIIGLCMYAKLLKSLPARFKVVVRVAPGSHLKEADVNKQLSDKERVAAALENPNLVAMLN